ncbi:hypothetical protein [Desulfurobacterium atlanticum]|uniref:Uncharacterized protein n=1 Tax=Desulfurobacterium atlanticum TaxID=240169 RepID=A0A239A5R8_9BACT|nr:hypothetical protein [Desulfurobacterium atlanticum]SNR90651.1 hypothetical protein SAMN06265340_11528 [Desulfurobacterium atlanticum]
MVDKVEEKKNCEMVEDVTVLKVPKDEIPELILSSMEERVKVIEKLIEESEEGEKEKLVEKIKTASYSIDTLAQIFQNTRLLIGDLKELVQITGEHELKKLQIEGEMEKIIKDTEFRITHVKEITETVRIQVSVLKEIALKLIDWAMNYSFSENEQENFSRKMEIVDRANTIIDRSTSIIEKLITS